MLNERRMYVQSLSDRLDVLMKNRLDSKRQELVLLSERLNGLSPLRKLSEGYAVVEDKNGNTISSVNNITKGDRLNIHMADGMIEATVDDKHNIKRSNRHGKDN